MFSMSRSSSGPSYTNFKGNIKVSSLIYVSTISLADKTNLTQRTNRPLYMH